MGDPKVVICPWACVGESIPALAQKAATLNQAAPKQKLTYAEIAKDRLERTVDIGQLPIPTMKGDTPVIKISARSVDKGLEQLKFSIVTRIEAQGRSMVDIKAGIADLWSDMGAKVSPLGKGYLLARFDIESDYKKVKFGGPWRYGKQLLRLTDWSPNFNVERQKHSNALVWVKFPGLSLEYWELDILMAMGRTVGTPVHVDRNTPKRDNGFYASVLVDVDLSKPSPNRILVEVEDKNIEFWQEITLGTLPDFCNNCKVVGHLTAGCRYLSPIPNEQGPDKEQDKFVKVVVNGKQHLKRKRKKNKGDHMPKEVIDIEPNTEKEDDAIVFDANEGAKSVVPGDATLPIAPHKYPVEELVMEPQIALLPPAVQPLNELVNSEIVEPLMALVPPAVVHPLNDEQLDNNQGIEGIPEGPVHDQLDLTSAVANNTVEHEQQMEAQDENLAQHQTTAAPIVQEGNNAFIFQSLTNAMPINVSPAVSGPNAIPPDIDISLELPTLDTPLLVENEALGSPTDEEIVPDSQAAVVKEAGIISRILEERSKKNKGGDTSSHILSNKDDSKDRKLVAKISKKKVALLPPGPLKDRLMSLDLTTSRGGSQ